MDRMKKDNKNTKVSMQRYKGLGDESYSALGNNDEPRNKNPPTGICRK